MFVSTQSKHVAGNRHYGYTCKWVGPNKPTYLLSNWCGWYRYKTAAQDRANALNKP